MKSSVPSKKVELLRAQESFLGKNSKKKKAKSCKYAKLIVLWLPEVFLSQSDGIGEKKPLVQAFDNLTSMPRLIDIEKTSNLMRDITYQSASLVPTVL